MKKYRNDIILVVAIALIAVVALIIILNSGKKDNLVAYIYHDEELVETLDMSIDTTVIVTGDVSELVIEVKDKKIRIVESNCHDHICVNQGYIDSSNQTITCLPNRILIKLISNEGADLII